MFYKAISLGGLGLAVEIYGWRITVYLDRKSPVVRQGADASEFRYDGVQLEFNPASRCRPFLFVSYHWWSFRWGIRYWLTSTPCV